LNSIGVIAGVGMTLIGLWGFGFNAFSPIFGAGLMLVGVVVFAVCWKL
jgi:hypothetical protein